MIVENGKICAKIKTGGGLDAEGYPVRPSSSFGDPVPCNIKVNKNSLIGKANGNTFTVASYEILIEGNAYDAEAVELLDSDGKSLGEFSVMQIEPLYAVGLVKILL